MDRRRVLIAFIVALPLAALAAQGGPVHVSLPPFPSAGAACKGSRVQVQHTDGKMWCCLADAWAECGSSGGGAGGLDTQVQFNDGGALGGDARFTFNKADGFVYAPHLALPNYANIMWGSDAGTSYNRAILYGVSSYETTSSLSWMTNLSTAQFIMDADYSSNRFVIANGPTDVVFSTSAGKIRLTGPLAGAYGMEVGAAGVSIGASGAPISGSYRTALALTPAAISAYLCADTTITASSAVVGAECTVGTPATMTAGVHWNCYVSAAGTVTLRFCNETTSSKTPTSGTYSVRVFNP